MTQEAPREPRQSIRFDPKTQTWVPDVVEPAPGAGTPPPGAGAPPGGGFGSPPYGGYRGQTGGGYGGPRPQGAYGRPPFGSRPGFGYGASQGAPPGAGGPTGPTGPSTARFGGPRAEDVQYDSLIKATAASLRTNKTRIASLMYDLTKEIVWRVGYGARIKRLIVKGATAVYRGFKRHILRMRG